MSTRDTNRRVRPFEWGAEFVGDLLPGETEADAVARYVDAALADSAAFYAAPPLALAEAKLRGERLTFPSAVETRWECNNTVSARYMRADKSRRAVIILPQWNADAESHMALGRLLARCGISALRLSLPYHDARMPAELERADYMISSNVGRTLQACRQAVLDVRQCVDWLESRGYTSVGIMGTSIGSCVSFLSYAHDHRLRAGVFNHVSSYFADVVWTGISTRHVRASLDGNVELETLRRAWLPLSPSAFVQNLKDEPEPRGRLFVMARYDMTFLPYLSDWLLDEFRAHDLSVDKAVLRCGHYTIGRFPWNWRLGYLVTSYMRRSLAEA